MSTFVLLSLFGLFVSITVLLYFSICLSLFSVCLFIFYMCVSHHLSMSLFPVCLFVYPYVSLFSVCLFVIPFVFLSIPYLSVHLCVSLSVSVPISIFNYKWSVLEICAHLKFLISLAPIKPDFQSIQSIFKNSKILQKFQHFFHIHSTFLLQ